MKKNLFNAILLTALLLSVAHGNLLAQAKADGRQKIDSNPAGEGLLMTLVFEKGATHNHPLMVVWLESEDGHFIETLFVSESIGKGVFKHADRSSGKWMPGEVERPAALPYWGHKRGIKSAKGNFVPDKNNPEPDAITGPTPVGDFELSFHLTNCPAGNCKILMEINQSWDWNDHWTNNRLDDPQYHASAQPSLVYEALVDPHILPNTLVMKPVGRGDEAGRSGTLFTDLETMTTALQIVGKITLLVGQ